MNVMTLMSIADVNSKDLTFRSKLFLHSRYIEVLSTLGDGTGSQISLEGSNQFLGCTTDSRLYYL